MISQIIFGTAVYIVLWWITLFVVLPFGVQSQQEKGKVVRGSERGAPVKPLMWKKLAATTLISAALLVAGYAVSYTGLFDEYVLPAKYLSDRMH